MKWRHSSELIRFADAHHYFCDMCEMCLMWIICLCRRDSGSLKTTSKTSTSRPKLTSEHCWKRQSSSHTGLYNHSVIFERCVINKSVSERKTSQLIDQHKSSRLQKKPLKSKGNISEICSVRYLAGYIRNILINNRNKFNFGNFKFLDFFFCHFAIAW